MSLPEPVSAPPTEPVFAEAWQAEAFAMTLALHQHGLFTWAEWAAALSVRVKAPGAAANGASYYEHWLAALEDILAAKAIVPKAVLHDMTEAWQRAAHATPHGKPIQLENDPHRRGATPP